MLLDAAAAAGVLPWAAGLLELELELELAQAARASTTTASPAALHILRMSDLSLHRDELRYVYVPRRRFGSLEAVCGRSAGVAADEAAHGERHRDGDSPQGQ